MTVVGWLQVCIGDGNLATAYEAYKGTLVLPNLVNELDNIVEVVSQPGEVVEVSAAHQGIVVCLISLPG